MSQNSIVSKEEIKQARQANIAQYLISKGLQLEKSGKRFRSKEYDSLVFTENAYFWNSKNEHGNAIDFATKYMNMDFTTAVKELAAFSNAPIKIVEQEFKIDNIELTSNMQRAIAYLNKSRCIDYKIIQDLIKRKLLYQSKENSNIVFPIKNENGDIVGAELNGTLTDKRFKGTAENSSYGYGFNIRTSQIKDLKNYMFFESAIDMLSYINIQYIQGTSKEFKDTIFVSMGGLKINIITHTLNAFKSNFEPNVFLCTDNISIDNASGNFCKTACNELKNTQIKSMLCSIYPKDLNRFPVIPQHGKDWNDQLKNMKKVSIKKKLNEVKELYSDKKQYQVEKISQSQCL